MKNLVKQKFKYELQRFDNIIHHDMARFLRHNPELDDSLIVDFQNVITDEAQIVKENLRHSVFLFNDDRVQERYIQFHQQALIGLAGHLLNYVAPVQLTNSAEVSGTAILSRILYQAVEDLLAFIEVHFTQYFDQDAWIPPSYGRIARYELATGLEALEASLAADNVGAHLLKITLQPLKEFVNDTMPSHITYRRVIYLKHLKKSLLRLGGAKHAGSINRQLRELLHYINFNSPEYVAYCVQYIERHLNSPDMSDHMGTLILDRYRKLIIQQPVKPSFSLDPVAPSLSHMLCEWIDAETWFVERSLQADDTSPAVPEGLISRFRIIVDLTSEQLSYFFRLLILAETIKNDNKTILSSIVSKVFLTNTEKGKKGTVRQKMYKASIDAKQAVRSLLVKMIALIDADLGRAGV